MAKRNQEQAAPTPAAAAPVTESGLESVLYRGHEINYQDGSQQYLVASLDLDGIANEGVHPTEAASKAIDVKLDELVAAEAEAKK